MRRARAETNVASEAEKGRATGTGAFQAEQIAFMMTGVFAEGKVYKLYNVSAACAPIDLARYSSNVFFDMLINAVVFVMQMALNISTLAMRQLSPTHFVRQLCSKIQYFPFQRTTISCTPCGSKMQVGPHEFSSTTAYTVESNKRNKIVGLMRASGMKWQTNMRCEHMKPKANKSSKRKPFVLVSVALLPLLCENYMHRCAFDQTPSRFGMPFGI